MTAVFSSPYPGGPGHPLFGTFASPCAAFLVNQGVQQNSQTEPAEHLVDMYIYIYFFLFFFLFFPGIPLFISEFVFLRAHDCYQFTILLTTLTPSVTKPILTLDEITPLIEFSFLERFDVNKYKKTAATALTQPASHTTEAVS